MDTTDWLLCSLVLVGYANWYATDPFRGSSWAMAALVVAGLAVLFDLEAISIWSREPDE